MHQENEGFSACRVCRVTIGLNFALFRKNEERSLDIARSSSPSIGNTVRNPGNRRDAVSLPGSVRYSYHPQIACKGIRERWHKPRTYSPLVFSMNTCVNSSRRYFRARCNRDFTAASDRLRTLPTSFVESCSISRRIKTMR